MQVWRFGDMGWQEEEPLGGHTDWVRDVAWAPNLGLPKNTIASAGQDGQVRGFALLHRKNICTLSPDLQYASHRQSIFC